MTIVVQYVENNDDVDTQKPVRYSQSPTPQQPSFFFKNLFFNCRKIALQYCVGFWHTTSQISHNYIYVLSLPLLTPTHPTAGSSQWAPGWVLCAAYSHFQQTIYSTHDSSYVSILLSQFVPPSSSPAVSTRLFSIFTSLFLPCIQVLY